MRFPFHPVVYHCPGERREDGSTCSRWVFLAALLVNALALTALGWGICFAREKRSQNDLHAQRPSSKFKATSVVIPAKHEVPVLTAEPPMPLATAEPELAEKNLEPIVAPTPPPEMPPSPPPLPESPPALEPPPVIPVVQVPEPLPAIDPIGPPAIEDDTVLAFGKPPGDSPMLRNWKMIDLAGLFAIVLASAPATAGGDKDAADIKTVLKKIETMDASLAKSFKDLGKDLGDLKKELGDLKGDHLTQRVEIDKLATKIETMEKQLAKLQGEKKSSDVASNYPPADKASLDKIEKRLSQIEEAMSRMQQSNRIALSPSSTGRVMFVNLYSEELLLTINGRPYGRVAPNRVLPIDNVPSGTFTYEVVSPTYGLISQRTSPVAPNETVTISAR
ncbi:MAG: hypothetical protein FJ271_15425 [Planctomycetes bacterium]|nr:hypothetical protein [Planctomycetota bacterium]